MRMWLNSFFKWAYRKKHIKEDIMLDVDDVKADPKKKEYLTTLEIDDIKDAAKKHNNKRDIALSGISSFYRSKSWRTNQTQYIVISISIQTK